MIPRSVSTCQGVARREFLRIGAAGLFGLGLPQVLQMEARARTAGLDQARGPRAKSVILVWLTGGPSTIDMWDLKPDAPAEIRGEFKPISTRVTGLRICEHLPRMAQMMDKCTVVRSLAHTIPDHGLGTTRMITGNRPTPVLRYPALGSLMARLSPAAPGVPSFVAFRGADNTGPPPPTRNVAGYLGPAYDSFEFEVMVAPGESEPVVDTRGVTLPTGFTLDQLENRNGLMQSFDRAFQAADRKADLVDGLDAFHRQALDILRSSQTRKALDLGWAKAELRARYGQTPFGQGCLAACRLVEAGVRFVTVVTASLWDTHARNFSFLRGQQLLPELDRTLSALIGDLDDRGLLDSTVVYCAGEFGRTPKINRNAGRDHWARSMAVLLAGGGFKKGYAHGGTDAHGMAPATDPCTPDDLAATLFHQLGIDPHQELQTPTGRPVQLFREGRVLAGLVE
jgi:hypothetical protein